MLKVLNLFVVLISMKELVTPVNGAGYVKMEDYIDPFDYAALVNIKDQLIIGDTAQAIDHVHEDIDKFEELSKKIHHLESAMAQHASNHIVDGDDVEDADLMLKEMDIHVLGVFKEHLVDLKEHMMQPHPPFNNETMQQIGALVNTAELFLNMSKMRVNQVEAQEEEWLEEEQSKMINDMMKQEMSENQLKVFRKKQPSKAWDGGLKEKLEKVEKAGGEDAPVGRSPGGGRVKMVVDKVKGVKEGEEAELQRRKKLTVESEGKFFWKAWDELSSQENTRQETNRKFRIVQLHGIEEGAYLVDQHHDEGDDHDDKSSRESFLKQGIGRHRLVFASASPFHSYRSLAIFSLVLLALALAVVVSRRNTSRSRPQRRQMFAELGPEVMVKKQQQGSSPAKEKGGFSYVELNEKKSPRGPGGEAANSWASGLASGLAAVALTPFANRSSPRVPGSRDVDKLK